MTDTAAVLRQRLTGTSQRKLAATLGVQPWDIADCLRGTIGRERENRIRAALNLPPLPVTIVIDPATQRVVKREPYKRQPNWRRLVV